MIDLTQFNRDDVVEVIVKIVCPVESVGANRLLLDAHDADSYSTTIFADGTIENLAGYVPDGSITLVSISKQEES